MCEREKVRERERPKDGGGWTEIRRKQRPPLNGRWNNQHEITFFVENLTDGITNNHLWKAFRSVGRLTDAYVAKKKDSVGNKFGFLRFHNVNNIDAILAKANEVKILEAVVKVTLARFDRNHKKIVLPIPINIPRSVPAWVPRNTGNLRGRQTAGTKYYNGGMSYSDIVKNKTNPLARKVIQIEGEEGLLPKHWKGKAVVGNVKNLDIFQSIHQSFLKAGQKEVGIIYLGGMKILLTFHDKKQAMDFIKEKEDLWSQSFSEVKVWNGEVLPVERLAKIRIRGVPITLKDDNTYNEIGRSYGTVVEGSKFTWSNTNVESDTCIVLVKQWERIDETVTLAWKDRNFDVKITEELEPWCPVFLSDDMEDGEIRLDSSEIPATMRPSERSEGERLHGEDNNNNGGNFNFEKNKMGPDFGEFIVGQQSNPNPRKRRRTSILTNTQNGPGITIPADSVVGLTFKPLSGNGPSPVFAPPRTQEATSVDPGNEPIRDETNLDGDSVVEETPTPMDEELTETSEKTREEEVAETMKVGGDIGIDLGNFKSEVAEIVKEDGVSNSL